ncbi:MAG TPA: acyl-CoA dehydratase activase [Terriglobales bacterium]|nr:acyl-CoA dehydratase activase [Terriglobales bacterium]
MNIHLGLDIGAVSLKLAVLGDAKAAEPLARLTAKADSFFRFVPPAGSGLAEGSLVLSRARPIHGNPLQATLELLEEFLNCVPAANVGGVRVTGLSGRLIAEALHAEFENEFRAVAKGVRALYPHARTVFEMGGETCKYIRLDPDGDSSYLGIADYSASGDCAAGTGGFIEQQASRLRYAVEDVGPAACGASCAARVAGRCSVFAKTDMIHAQQKGYGTDQILRGLCDAVARNFKSSIVKGHQVAPPVLFIGGVALNQGVRNALREAFKLQEHEFIVPELYSWMGALGAALFEKERLARRRFSGIERLREVATARQDFPSSDPLSLANVELLRDQVSPPPPFVNAHAVEAYLGIDIGSVSTNLVVLDAHGRLLKEIYLATEGRPIEVVNRGLAEIKEQLGARLDLRGVGTTGSGRELIGELVGADIVTDEITAHKTGAMHVCREMGMAPVDTIFEIGGQDSKFIRIERGVVVDFTMNEACAAGTGSFLEEQAERLGISIKGEFARLALSSERPARLGERCTVFMERDVNGLLRKGAQVADLCAGLAYSVALNYLNRVVRGRKIGDVIFFQGGTAYNDAVAAAFSQILNKTVIVPPHNGVIGAIGMALIARERMQARRQRSRFRGYDLSQVNFSTRDFVCKACSNYCDMKEFVIEGQRSFWGDKCSDKFRKRPRGDRQPVIEDLLEFREQLLEQAVASAPLKLNGHARPRVGIPRAMFFYDRGPFWATYLRELGFEVVTSRPTDGRMAAAGDELAIAQPCFPVIVAHGHVQDLLQRGVDYVLVPNTLDYESPDPSVKSHLCPWNQTLPFVLRAAPKLEDAAAKLLAPTVHFRLGEKHVRKALQEFARGLGVARGVNQHAVSAAYTAQQRFRERLLQAGERALAQLEKTGEPALVLLGRPYNLYDRSINCDVPRKLRTLYGANVIPLDFLRLEEEDISEINDNMYWNSGRLILAAARITRRYPNLHLVYISNFKCGPDSYIKSFVYDASGKPSLLLQFDGHSNDAGFLTRCEAYLDSKGFLRCNSVPTTV